MMMQPLIDTVPVPVYTVPAQQKRYSPVCEFSNNTVFGLLSSWRQISNTFTEKLQLALLPAVSVATHVTAVEPVGKHVPLGGEHTTCAPGQSSITVGVV